MVVGRIRADRIPVAGFEHAGRRQAERAVPGIENSSRRIGGQKSAAGERHIERIVGLFQHALAEVDPVTLDVGERGLCFGFGRGVQVVEFAIRFVAGCAGVRNVVGQQIERFDTRAHPAGRRGCELVHNLTQAVCAIHWPSG
jgi:hypothetical protein